MSLSHDHERGIQPTATSSPNGKGLASPSGSPSLLRASLKAYKSVGKRESRASGSPGYMPLGENVNGLKNRSRHIQPRSDKNYQEIYTLPETPALEPEEAPSTPSRARRTGNSTSTHFTTPSGMRLKRKRAATVETSDSEDIVSAAEPLVRPPKDPADASESSAREDRMPNGTTLSRHESGLFGRKPPASGETLGEEEFDSLIYDQTDASRPSLKSLFDRRKPTDPRGESGVSGSAWQAGPCLHIRMDPKIHWTHPQSEEWHRRKQEEIRFRGTRKENCGKAAQRMHARRLRDTLISGATPAAPAANDPGSNSFGRPMDFGDVPEAELPEMVKSNPEWLKAAAWMRKCRRKSLERQKEIERRRKAGLPWKGLLGASGIK